MGLTKPQRHKKIEVAGIIYYGNIREPVFKRQIRFLSHPFRSSLILTAAVSGRRHPCSWRSDVHVCPLSAIVHFPFWNSLPSDVTSAPTLAVFRNRLKTHLKTISWITLNCFSVPTSYTVDSSGLAVFT